MDSTRGCVANNFRWHPFGISRVEGEIYAEYAIEDRSCRCLLRSQRKGSRERAQFEDQH